MILLFITLQQDTSLKVVAEGVASLHYSEDVARDRALKDALRNAVERALGTFVSSRTMVENFRLIEDRILSRTRGYVKSYRILSEEKEDGLYRIRVLAEVSAGKLKEDLEGIRLLSIQKGRPLIYISTPEKRIRDFFMDRLSGDGFSLAEDSSRADLILKLDYMEKAEERDLGYEASIRIFHLYLSSRVIDRRGEVVSASALDREFPGINDRIINLFLENAYRDIKERLLGRWREMEIVDIEVNGADFEGMRKIRDILKENLRGLKRIIIRNMTDGYAAMEVISDEDAQAIADILKEKLSGAYIEFNKNNQIKIFTK